MRIDRCDQFNLALSRGPYAWPGGYPLYFICHDGEALSFSSAVANAHLIRDAIIGQDTHSGWWVVGLECNWEDQELYCAHDMTRIPSAYGED